MSSPFLKAFLSLVRIKKQAIRSGRLFGVVWSSAERKLGFLYDEYFSFMLSFEWFFSTGLSSDACFFSVSSSDERSEIRGTSNGEASLSLDSRSGRE